MTKATEITSILLMFFLHHLSLCRLIRKTFCNVGISFPSEKIGTIFRKSDCIFVRTGASHIFSLEAIINAFPTDR